MRAQKKLTELVIMDPLNQILTNSDFQTLAKSMEQGNRVVATGSAGCSIAYMAMALRKQTKRRVLIVCAHLDEAEDIHAETVTIDPNASTLFPALELSPGETSVSADLFTQRLLISREIDAEQDTIETSHNSVIVAPIAALMQPIPALTRSSALIKNLEIGQTLDPQDLIKWLSDHNYDRVDTIESAGQFAIRGGILDVFPSTGSGGVPIPIRLDFFGDDLETISEIDLETMGSDRKIESAQISAAGSEYLEEASDDQSFLEIIPSEAIVLIAETFEVIEQGRGYFERIHDGRRIYGPPAVLKILETRFHALAEMNQFSAGKSGADTLVALPVESVPPFDRETGSAIRELGELAKEVGRVVLACASEGEFARLGELISMHAREASIEKKVVDIRRGFIWRTHDPDTDQPNGIAIVPSGELLHRSSVRRRVSKIRAGRAMDTFLDIQEGDYVVHTDHGIAKFLGLTILDASGTSKQKQLLGPQAKKRKEDQEEYLTLEFKGKARLHVPCSQIDLVQKYVGGFSGKPPLSSIGGKKWKAQKQRVAESVKDLASEMLRVRAAREHVPGFQYPVDTPLFTEFEAEFPYTETEDQLSAMIEIKKDMQSQRPMDRLICGDVGFGKTELAIRAACKAVEAGRQVAVLVPTTVLAEQHERTFKQRFADYPFRIESLSRFKTTKEVKRTLEDLKLGRVDIVVGTHRILSKDVQFDNLGMVIIDEEQRFGVEHKERLLQLRLTVDVLTLSATPIPRTLHMSMLGLRDISSLTTPPVDRRAIVTEVIPYNRHRIQRAMERELAREGQVYFVHNRVSNIQSVAADVKALVPDARVIYGHGQMEPRELEQVMLKFMRRQADILVSTTIIEAGIDIPTANTMIINDADRFGLSELHQLRGRVGRSHPRAYCYLLLPEDRTVKEVAQKRLKAIEEYSMLGAGFKIAMRDLEIRGAGNLLGAEQSGHIAAVGYEMYCQLLDQTVERLTDATIKDQITHTSIDIGLIGYIPKAYIPSDARRIEVYRRLASAGSQTEIDQVVENLTSAYTAPPELVRRLIMLARVRASYQPLGVRSLSKRGDDLVFLALDPQRLVDSLASERLNVRVIEATLAQTNARTSAGESYAEIYVRPPKALHSPMSIAKSLVSWSGE